MQVLIVLLWLAFSAAAAAAGHVVAIDPAHGGDDTGVKLSRGVYEKDVTLAVAKFVQVNLSESGVQVRLTRSDDRALSLLEREKIVQGLDADLFIALHINAGFGQKAEGYEIYYLGVTAPSAETDDPQEILKDMEQTKRLNNSVFLAQIMQKNMEEVFPRKGRGLRDAPVRALQSLTVPAVLLEMGFATSLSDREKLKDVRIQKSVADAVVRSVKEYFLTGGTP